MHKLTLIGIASLVALLAVAASTALASGGKGGKGGRGVVVGGKCSAGSVSKLKAKFDDGRVETEFEVDQNRVGRRWRVTVTQNGARVFTGIRTTVAPSGSFSVHRLLAGSASNRIVATATALRGGETCRAALSL
jgi:hypothetical protein